MTISICGNTTWPAIDPDEDPSDDRPDQDQLPSQFDGDDDEYARCRTLVPRTAMTARAYLEARTEAERILALPAVVQVRNALSRYTCLSCGDALPAGRGGHCDACTEWSE